MKTTTTHVRIVEAHPDGGWLLHWTADRSEMHGTAMDALSAVKQRDELAVASGADVSITTITWEPVSRIGRLIVRAVTGAK